MQVEQERDSLLKRKEHLESRLVDIIGPPLPSTDVNVPIVREESHWDHVMKELVGHLIMIILHIAK